MSNSVLQLTRNQLAEFLPNQRAVRAFEQLLLQVGDLLPSDIATLNRLIQESAIEASSGSAKAQSALDTLSAIVNLVQLAATNPPRWQDRAASYDYLDISTTAPTATPAVGRFRWNDTEGTLDLGLKGGNVTLQIGQENVLLVKNDDTVTLTDGMVVYVSGASGANVLVKRALANSDITSASTIGVVTEHIAVNGQGFVTTFGAVRGLNTNAFNEGDILYLSPTVAGELTNVKPVAPQHLVTIGFCTKKSGGSGEVFVSVNNGYELDELHNVLITAPVLAGSTILYDATNAVWKNARLTAGSNITITNADGSVTIAASGVVTSIGVTAPLTSTGGVSPTLGITQSGAASNGYLSSTDWSTFNSKEPAIASGTTAQYWRGDKTWQTLNSTAVGLGNVSNDAQLKQTSNLSDLANAATARANLGLGSSATLNVDTDGTLSANSDTRVPSQKAVKTYVDNAVTGLLDLKGSLDCSTNPNYPAASKGDAYYVTVAGKVGGASGVSVDVGDMIVASADNAGGTQAAVGSSWFILEHNLQGALLASNNLSDLTNASTARTNLGVAIGTNVQAWDADLDAIAALAGTSGFLKKTAANTWSLDTTSYSPLAGSSSIVTVGTITSGTWNGTTVATGYGGTGLTSFASGSILYASSTSALGNSGLYSNGTNIGLNNSSPLAWSTGNALTIGTKAAFANDSNYGTVISSNLYYSAGWKIATTGAVPGAMLAVGNYGRLYFYAASAGTAGNASTLTQFLYLDGNSGGYLYLGPPSGSAAQDYELHLANTNYYSRLKFDRNGTTFATIFGFYGNGLYYDADVHQFRNFSGTNTFTIDTNGNHYGPSGTTSMTNGFSYIPSAAGAPTGVPTAVAGHVPMYYDTTNNKFYIYNGAWKSIGLI